MLLLLVIIIYVSLLFRGGVHPVDAHRGLQDPRRAADPELLQAQRGPPRDRDLYSGANNSRHSGTPLHTGETHSSTIRVCLGRTPEFPHSYKLRDLGVRLPLTRTGSGCTQRDVQGQRG